MRYVSTLRSMFANRALYADYVGWVRSFMAKSPMGPDGAPVPWYTYPAIAFLEKRVHHDFRVLEYGSGSSTLYFAERAAAVVSIEDNREWYARIGQALPKNCEIHLATTDYADLPAKLQTDPFDLVIVDGIDRVECVAKGVPLLAGRGVLILDDSERAEYQPARESLSALGFRELPFWGVAPGMVYRKCTSLFYRSGNCLAI